ncbi:TRM11 family SAM-dependent methyltransferase [Granulicoccus phenolivorans]|uniref:TRM11 family SAM-dependent methyltransferase n=1 Tax=Granulicoccus phenolivorans TaxID=266854 RepID=UPI0011AE1DF2|nr:site-specific DNA-methyltransferase [Granulicoccus phenolivorans]
MRYLMLIAPASNRAYAQGADRLAAAELAICTHARTEVEVTELAGVGYLRFATEEPLSAAQLLIVARQSTFLALFELTAEDLLRPVPVPAATLFDDDLLTIPKYPGKTNEQFTRLLVNITLAAVQRPAADTPWTVLDPLAGRGTTAAVALTLGLNAAGVEGDQKSVEAMSAFWKTWLRRKRLKHSADMSPVRRDGKSLGRRFDATVQPPDAPERPRLELTVFTGDTRQSAKLFGKRRFEAIVTDAPYGVVHGASTDVRGVSGKRDRSPAGLLREAIPVWASQLKPGGALGISWNTHGLTREELAEMMAGAGLEALQDGPWLRFGHRVDSSIQRDVLVARRPIDQNEQ